MYQSSTDRKTLKPTLAMQFWNSEIVTKGHTLYWQLFCINSLSLRSFCILSFDESTAAGLYILLRAADRFAANYNKFSGQYDGDTDEDIFQLKTTTVGLLNDLGCNGSTLSEDLINEMSQYNASELHAIASFVGEVASQEVIKIAFLMENVKRKVCHATLDLQVKNVVKILEDGDLQTLGMLDYNKRLQHSFTAHSKVDPVTDLPIILILLVIVTYEMRFNMKNGLASQKKLSESVIDFPRVNENYTGKSAVTRFFISILKFLHYMYKKSRMWINEC
ncbi:hypothetical protein BC332_19604 [Capsicum chinense]|nr:hypothetical protein BC332_19604 [Capsicum chinense]